jgi:hypothetical protein
MTLPPAPDSQPVANTPNPWVRWGIVAIIGVGAYLGAQSYFADSALRIDMRHAMGVDKGDDGFKPRAFAVSELPPAPPELIEKLKTENPKRVQALMIEHFDSMVTSRDWHVMDDRAVQRRIRALDLATTLGLVKAVEKEVRQIAEHAATGAKHYANDPAVTAESTTGTLPLSQLRDRQYYRNAVRLREAAERTLR